MACKLLKCPARSSKICLWPGLLTLFHISPCLTVHNSTKPQPFMVYTHTYTTNSLPYICQVPSLPGTFTISLIPSFLAWPTLTSSLRLNSASFFWPSLCSTSVWVDYTSGVQKFPVHVSVIVLSLKPDISCPHFYPHHLMLSVLPPKHISDQAMSFSPHCSYPIWAFSISYLTCCGGLPSGLPNSIGLSSTK